MMTAYCFGERSQMEALSQQLCQDYRVDQSAQAVEALRREKYAYFLAYSRAPTKPLCTLD